MAGSIVIYGGNRKMRKERAAGIVSKTFKKVEGWGGLGMHPDIQIIDIPNDKKSIGIADVKGAVRYVQEKPFSAKSKFLVINNAQALTREAQNALLKTLEEPPSYTTIILLTKTLNHLLETVVSRCRKVQATTEKKIPGREDTNISTDGPGVSLEYSLKKILRLGGGERLEWAGEFSKEEKEEIVELLEKWLEEARELMLESPSPSKIHDVKLIYAAKKDLENTNTGSRLALEALVINLSGV